VRTVQAHLYTPQGARQVFRVVAATGRPLDAAALKAGVGRGRLFLDINKEHKVKIIGLSVTLTIRLPNPFCGTSANDWTDDFDTY